MYGCDFNEILNNSEKEEGNLRLIRQILKFREAVANCGLKDLGFYGNQFTWIISRCGGLKKMLDHVFGNARWLNLFPRYFVQHLKPSKSDHIPIMMELGGLGHNRTAKPLSFRFEEWWVQHDECKDVVKEAWYSQVSGFPMFQVTEKIKATRVTLLKWQCASFKMRKVEIEQIRSRLSFIMAQPLWDHLLAERSNLMLRLDELLADEERFWRQRSRIQWLKEGDRNTRFFHMRASTWKTKNKINGLLDKDGVWHESDQQIERTVI